MGDGLPQSICQNCIDKLMVCRDFWNQCHSATKVLNTILEEHLNNDIDMKQGVCTEIVYLVILWIIYLLLTKYKFLSETWSWEPTGNISTKIEKHKNRKYYNTRP